MLSAALSFPSSKDITPICHDGLEVVPPQPAITCSKLTIKTPERRQLRRSGVFNVNFEHTSHLALVLLLLTLSR